MPMRPQVEQGPCCSSGRPCVHSEPCLCSRVPRADAQRSCSYLLILGSNFIPSLWFKVPGEVVAMVKRKRIFLPSLS